ncbi:MAG: chemotaxis protein CheW [Bacillota bacterium]|nr:chemotaxis protein CheW [Bacillota bacterium]
MSENNKAVVFRIAKEEYAIPIQYVISIEKMENITPIPHLPHYVKGIVEVRNELIPVIDLENILYKRNLEVNEVSRLIVLESGELSLGALVNEVKEIIDIPKGALKEVGLIAYSKTAYITGIANLDHRLITVLDPALLVDSLEGIRDIKEYMKSRH